VDTHARNNNRKILCWNVHEINSQSKLSAIRSKISEIKCDIICLQETKRKNFDQNYIRQFCPPAFDRFKFISSVGNSGGTIIIWMSTRFSGQVVSHNDYAMSVEFESMMTGEVWVLTNVYVPCTPNCKEEFFN
jgi:exonuclease III